jgi:hypothetical protein
MEYVCNTEFCNAVDELLLRVRVGDTTNPGENNIWDQMPGARECPLHQLRLRTALWDHFYILGDYARASRELREGGIVDQAVAHLERSIADPDQFLQKNFPDGKDRVAYRYWRQCAMGALALAHSGFQEHEPGHGKRLLDVASFIDDCLARAEYTCNGVRARLHFFRGIVFEADYQLDASAAEYERAVSCLISRAERKLADHRSPKYEAERSFIIYCLGKIELRFAQLDFERGRLALAKRHAWEAGLLLRSSNDIHLPCVADLLTYQIRRYETNFINEGWDLVKEISKHATMANKHVPNRLAASIEHVKTCVYLRHLKAQPPDDDPACLTLEKSLTAIEGVIRQATGPALQRTRFSATLVKIRTLNRLKRWKEADEAIQKAKGILRPLPKPLQAELTFTKGKVRMGRGHAAQSEADAMALWREAHDLFRQADKSGHSSVTFRIACRLEMAEALRLRDKIVEAGEDVAIAARQLKDVEHTFLHQRLARIEKHINLSGMFISRFDKGTTLKREREKFYRAYLLALTRRYKIEVEDLRSRFSQLDSPGLSPTELDTLLAHYERNKLRYVRKHREPED